MFIQSPLKLYAGIISLFAVLMCLLFASVYRSCNDLTKQLADKERERLELEASIANINKALANLEKERLSNETAIQDYREHIKQSAKSHSDILGLVIPDHLLIGLQSFKASHDKSNSAKSTNKTSGNTTTKKTGHG